MARLSLLGCVSAWSACGTTSPTPPEEGPVPKPPGYVSISAGFAHVCVVRDDGTLRCWGDGQHGQLGNGVAGTSGFPVVKADGVTEVAQVSAGYMQTCALFMRAS